MSANYLNSLSGPTATGIGIPGTALGSGSGIRNGLSQDTYKMSKITVFGITILLIYTITNILNFYGVGVDKYGAYLVFYIFLLLCYYILNRDNPKI
jgi:hypothetical protein